MHPGVHDVDADVLVERCPLGRTRPHFLVLDVRRQSKPFWDFDQDERQGDLRQNAATTTRQGIWRRSSLNARAIASSAASPPNP